MRSTIGFVALTTTLLLACGNDEEAPSEEARLDVHGTVGTARIDLTNANVTFKRNGVDDSLTSFETLDGDRILSLDLVGRFPTGTHVMDAAWGDGWDSSIAGAIVGYYEGEKDWQAWSSKYSDHHATVTFTVKTSAESELSGEVTATLVPSKETTGTPQAKLDVRIHGFRKGQNHYGGAGSSGSSSGSGAGAGRCQATAPFSDDFGKGTICTEAPCDQTAGSTQNFQPGTCSTARIKYGCCGIPKGLVVYAYDPCTTGNCESLEDWNRTCGQLGGTGRTGACP